MLEGTTTREEVKTRRIGTEDQVRALLDRINLIRTDLERRDRIPAWSEALEALADMVLPWSDDPKEEELFQKEWEDRPVAVVDTPGGAIVVPTARDCREHQRIILKMLDRRGLLVKRRNVSGPGPRKTNAAPEEASPTQGLEM